jgi:single-strand DNA-binding protein
MSAFAQIIGRLGQEPALTYTHNGTPVINLSVASNRQRKDGNGERVNIADWFKVTAFGREAEVIAQYANKGSLLAFNGRLQTDSYSDREGQQRTSTYLIADSFEFMPSAKRPDENNGEDGEPDNAPVVKLKASAASATKNGSRAKAKISDDDIPFLSRTL